MKPAQEQRRVDGQTFAELATSRRSFQRLKNLGESMLGLLDRESQMLYVTSQTELQRYIATFRSSNLPTMPPSPSPTTAG